MIRHEHRGPVSLVTIDRPERRNAVDPAALDGLSAAVGEATAAGSRVLVLTGSGGHFCAGADLGGVDGPVFLARLGEVVRALGQAPFPVVAAIEGAALGAGTQLAVACDLRVATPAARFGIPAARLGLAVDRPAIDALVARLGDGPARSMLLGAQEWSGADAHRIGFVQRLGDRDDALAWADELAALAPLTQAAHKAGLAEGDGSPAGAGTGSAFDRAFAAVWASEDRDEGLAAFRERRPPVFRG